MSKKIEKEKPTHRADQFGPLYQDDAPSYIGMILGILIIILMLLLGGLYLWGETQQKNTEIPNSTKGTRPTAAENNEPESTNAEAAVETLSAMSTSDELSAIEADLSSTIISDPEAELTSVEAELTTNP